MQEKRLYIKSNLEKEHETGIDNTAKKSIPIVGVLHLDNTHYIKPDSTVLPKAFVVIFSGGEEREKDYFHLITKNPDIYSNIRIDFFPNPNFKKGGKPEIVEFAINKKKDYQESVNEDNPDSYYLLTDIDHFEEFLQWMAEECNKNDIELIISNSCFEVWLYYAEKDDKCVDFIVPKNILEISSEFKTWANTVVKGGLKPTKAILKIEQNIENARKNYSEENGIPTLFSTQMYRLAEKMLPYIKEGNEIIIQNNANHKAK
jgi:hypothetical protein